MEKVAIVECGSYDGNTVRSCLERIIDLLEINLAEQFIKPVLLKPNLCLPVQSDSHLTTHPEIIVQLIKLLEKNGHTKICIGDTSIGAEDREKKVWSLTGMDDVISGTIAQKCDFNSDIEKYLIDTESGVYEIPVSKQILKYDIINVPKLKTHGYMLLTGCVKNMYGILAGDSKKNIHKIAENKEEFSKILMEIYKFANCKLNIVDAVIGIEGDGPGAKGTPRKVGVIVAGKNGVAVDRILARLINIPEVNILTNRIFDDIELVGDDIRKYIVKDYKLPEINSRTDSRIEHVIISRTSIVEILHKNCSGCGICAKNCPINAIYKAGDKMKIDRSKCIKCLVCHESCPNGTINVRRNNLFKGIG